MTSLDLMIAFSRVGTSNKIMLQSDDFGISYFIVK